MLKNIFRVLFKQLKIITIAKKNCVIITFIYVRLILLRQKNS